MVNTVSHPAPRQDTLTHTIYRAGASPARFHRRLGTMERGPRRLGSRPGMRKRERIGQNVGGGSMSGELISGSPAARADPVRSGWRGSRPGSPWGTPSPKACRAPRLYEVFPFRLRPHPANAPASLTDDDGSTSHDRRSSKKARP